MLVHREARIVPHSAEEMFDLVADVHRYPEFLRWCRGARITHSAGEAFDTELLVRFGVLEHRYCFHVQLSRPDAISISNLNGSFPQFEGGWSFKTVSGGCCVSFYIAFQFCSATLDRLTGPLFYEAVQDVPAAFNARAEMLYRSRRTSPPAA